MNELGRVVDPEALERLDGTRGRMRIEVLQAWVGGSVRIAVPRQLLCASCDGGGCDRCERSGALRAPTDGSLDVRLPSELGDGVVVRVVRPFGDDGALGVLLIEVRVGSAAVACVLTSSPGSEVTAPPLRPGRHLVEIAVLALAIVLIVAALALR